MVIPDVKRVVHPPQSKMFLLVRLTIYVYLKINIDIDWGYWTENICPNIVVPEVISTFVTTDHL